MAQGSRAQGTSGVTAAERRRMVSGRERGCRRSAGVWGGGSEGVGGVCDAGVRGRVQEWCV